MTLETQLTALQVDLKSHFEKAAEEKKSNGTILEATKASIDTLQKQVDAIDTKLAERHAGDAASHKSLPDLLKESEAVSRLVRDHNGRATFTLKGNDVARLFETKTTITSPAVGVQTTGVLQIDRIAGITTERRQVLKVRDLLTARPTTMQVVDFVKVVTPMIAASMQVEAGLKAENAVTFASQSEKVRVIAAWLPATKQILDDFSELAGFINSSLPYYVNLAEEIQLLSGDGTGENLHGLITQATAFDGTLLSTPLGWNKLDVVGRAIQQITAAKELDPTFIVMHPNDFWGIRLTKDGFGRYILGEPQTNVAPTLFGLDVVTTTSIANGTFLVGSGTPVASEIRDRQEMTVEISTENSDYFVRNMVAVRAEKRLALVVKRPASYVTGTLSEQAHA